MIEHGKRGQIIFAADRPMQIAEEGEANAAHWTEEQHKVVSQIGSAIKEYIDASKKLLNDGKFSHLKELAPLHLVSPGNVLIAGCSDGVIIRYERKSDEKGKIILAWFDGNLSDNSPLISQKLVYCHYTKSFTSSVPHSGHEINFSAVNPTTNESKNLFSMRVGFDALVKNPPEFPKPPHKPYCLLSVRNSLELGVRGEMLSDDKQTGTGQEFITKTSIRLPVGWECIEIFPFINLDYWKPEYAALWAENDILAAVVTQQFRDAKYKSLDPNAMARKEFSALLTEFRRLLDSNPDREEILQSFLKENPILLCPTFVKVWPKLALGARVTDFVFRDASGTYMLVELERSTFPLFTKNGDTTSQLNHARDQIADWKRYLEDNLSTVERELDLRGISTSPKCLIVIGRSQSLTAENRRKLTTLENQSPTLKIMTYDDLLENAKIIGANLFGPLTLEMGDTEIYYLQKNKNIQIPP